LIVSGWGVGVGVAVAVGGGVTVGGVVAFGTLGAALDARVAVDVTSAIFATGAGDGPLQAAMANNRTATNPRWVSFMVVSSLSADPA
jgi:hypothetical protein